MGIEILSKYLRLVGFTCEIYFELVNAFLVFQKKYIKIIYKLLIFCSYKKKYRYIMIIIIIIIIVTVQHLLKPPRNRINYKLLFILLK